MSTVIDALIVALTVAVLTSVYLIALVAAERFMSGFRFIPLALIIIVVTSILTTVSYLLSPLLWVLVWIALLVLATPLAAIKLTRTYPRRSIENLLTERISTVLGKDWARGISIKFSPDNIASTVIITIPKSMIPSDITPRLKATTAETLSGTWQSTVKDTRIILTRLIVKPDPPHLRDLKGIVCSPKAFTGTSKITHYQITDFGEVLGFTVKYTEEIAAAIALGHRKRDIQKLITERIDAGEGNSLSFEWETKERACTVKRSVFAGRIDNKPAVPVARSVEDALAIYPNLEIPVGEDELGNPVTWKLVGRGQPHGLFVGATGSGKSSTNMTTLAHTSLAGMCIIIVDFKCDKEFNGWRDWPNVHLVAQDVYSCLRAIAYVKELMDRRKEGGASLSALHGAPAPSVPILLIVDEFTVCTKLLDPLWRQFRKDDKSLPPTPPTIEDAGSILREGRSLLVHEASSLQRATADNIPREFVFNSPFTIQCGPSDSTTSFNLWDDADIGQTIPYGVPGRALTRGPSGFVQFQGYFTPDPATAKTDRDLAVLESLRPPVSLYPRMVIDMPDADKIERWDQIVTAPIVSADSRPDLDPLSPKFTPRRVYRVDTTSKIINAASMQLVTITGAAAPAPAVVDEPEIDEPIDDDPDQDLEELDTQDDTDEPDPQPDPEPQKRRRATRSEPTQIRSIQGEAFSKPTRR
ncbi:FtsK/SpoIIIE domain-containing protein [Mycobacteroides salmoniphilum]|uniref:FtsK/SpoIIIE family protein n=1 Tax=Mycobacteroides salmoniphilum TaxID=404941 RepID=A0A4R8T054_9MYCO|nr:FtsK/SpoIIIE domain-containing protein [Mycobacteroides salmoniphilum]TEA09233.1 FtsK/SpoIIIE family protein [Mycobacteroides salmoniphilum]